MLYMVPFFFYTHNFVIEEVLHYIKELCKFSHMNKKTLHSFSHGLINFCECPTRVLFGYFRLCIHFLYSMNHVISAPHLANSNHAHSYLSFGVRLKYLTRYQNEDSRAR